MSEAEQCAVEELESTDYNIKWITVQGVNYAIVMQNENGPCPLLAIVNVLLLRGQISLANGCIRIHEKELLQHVADCVLRFKPKDINESELPNYEQNVSDVLTLIPSLPQGLDVNVQFTGVKKFEYTSACALFDILNIPLMHGWIIDHANAELVKYLSGISYNQLLDKLVSSKDDLELCLLRDFLDSNASQLTNQGITELLSSLDDGQIAVLFRNNHFHTMSKHQNALFVLATDLGFLNEPAVVWETLDNIDGDSKFADASFRISIQPGHIDDNSDYLFALSIHEEDERRQQMSRMQSQAEVSAQSEVHNAHPGSDENLVIAHSNLPASHHNKKTSCTML